MSAINQKVIDIFDKINAEFPKENHAYDADSIRYGFTQRVMEHTLNDVLNAVDSVDLREKTFTTYDRSNLEFCKQKVKKEIYKLIEQIRSGEK